MERSNYEILVQQKQEIERKMSENNQILIEEGNIGMEGNLVDRDGYPRSDIDLYKVRHARQQIICLQNDYKTLMKEIEREIIEIHSKSNSDKIVEKLNVAHEEDMTLNHKPFARITQVDTDSPAFEAGLKQNDEIVQFGPLIHSNTNKNLSEIASLVKNSINKIILLNVLRVNSENELETKLVKIKLVPKQWSGHGVLGCRIVPFE
jgi:26S proteasome non-ATPase regulatory subunit 9